MSAIQQMLFKIVVFLMPHDLNSKFFYNDLGLLIPPSDVSSRSWPCRPKFVGLGLASCDLGLGLCLGLDVTGLVNI
jgi:hypothetical protein